MPYESPNRAAVLTDVGRMVIEERTVPELAADEVLVRVEAVGVCGSDAHYFRHGRIGQYVVEAPLVLGHETAGVVVALGAEVTSHRVGDRVAIEPGVPCGRCEQCRTGRYNLCPDVIFHATPPVDGTLQSVVAIRADYAFSLPENVSTEQGALVEPLAVSVWACRKAAIAPGARVLVTGAGPVGLLTAQTARAFGASQVTVTDIDPEKLRLAAELGADATVPAGELADLDAEFDVHIECSGNGRAARDGIARLGRAGVAVLVGMGASEGLDIPASWIQEKELVITGVFRYANCFPVAIELVATGRVRVEPLISHRFPLADSGEAIDTAGRAGVFKTLILPQL
ncbi:MULTISPECIES: NAD(P)-dependent alcohol dehydrogenase [unclassified Microbacterium]|uniref:NAD(P)-dependent alcohol dehydrogenase n=1 Tax=unclassified Microbacterium TaxID=2609290 RepID=UPI001604F3EF|nr:MULTISPECIES: NAD(P)-dependent alcohol dehydrogenase [unclassified Microbacterium]QNA93593.1 NAD(P)-dependent alcohol dehydrogenase [Microbacterium sp. Se63.02b]QYM63852.1 NAD(P)-dependent alcohol dehydrogenase [Microbacterium sp. Se5.02b]